MRATINNLISNIRSNANEATKLARAIANIPAVDLDSIKVWNAPTNEKTGDYTSVEFVGIHAKFTWHDHRIEMCENHNGKIVVSYDDQKIGEIYWSALWGKLESMPNYTEVKNNKAMNYMLDTLWTCVHRISAKGRPYEKVALPKKVQYGDYTIYAEGATIYAEHNGEKISVMGNTWRGLTWTQCDHRVTELQKVIKKAFVVY